MKDSNKRQIILSIFFLLLLISSFVIYGVYFVYNELHLGKRIMQWQRILIIYIQVVLCMLNIYTMRTLFLSLNILKSSEIYKNSVHSLDKLLNTLRAQKHEFNNHLQIIWGLININKTKEAIKYIETVNSNLSSVSKFYGLGCIELSALLYAKYSIAEKLNIKFQIKYNVDLSIYKFDSIDLINICGNLIDNAFSFAKKSIMKIVNLSIIDLENYIIISVENSGSYIEETEREKIFEFGYSTKNSTGIGLFIVKSIIEKYNGFVLIDSYYDYFEPYQKEAFTSFEVYLQKKSDL
ncbi:sensor histidine kinase [Caldicellulosiruptoraceae bacterium PP1]